MVNDVRPYMGTVIGMMGGGGSLGDEQVVVGVGRTSERRRRFCTSPSLQACVLGQGTVCRSKEWWASAETGQWQ